MTLDEAVVLMENAATYAELCREDAAKAEQALEVAQENRRRIVTSMEEYEADNLVIRACRELLSKENDRLRGAKSELDKLARQLVSMLPNVHEALIQIGDCCYATDGTWVYCTSVRFVESGISITKDHPEVRQY